LPKYDLPVFDWEKILAETAKKLPELNALLAKGRLVAMDNGAGLLVADFSLSPEVIIKLNENSELVRELQELIYEYTGKMYKIDFRDEEAMKKIGNQKDREKYLREKDAVKEAVELLGAKIIDIKPY
jgi:hypothetical protein